MGSEIAEGQDAWLGVEDKPEFQSDSTFEKRVAKAADAEAGVQMGDAEAVADGGDNLADLLALSFRKSADDRLQFRSQLNPQCPLRCRH